MSNLIIRISLSDKKSYTICIKAIKQKLLKLNKKISQSKKFGAKTKKRLARSRKNVLISRMIVFFPNDIS